MLVVYDVYAFVIISFMRKWTEYCKKMKMK